MSLFGYFLEGVQGEKALVIKTEDEEQLYYIIKRLAHMRPREIRALGERLEREWNVKYGTNE